MSILQEASVGDRQRLLALFPVANLREWFPFSGTKEEICAAAAKSHGNDHLAKVAQFVDRNLSLCKQHVYILTHQGDAVIPKTLSGAEPILVDKNHSLFLVRTTYNALLLDPLEKTTLDFLWPVKIEIKPNYLSVRFVVLEKSLSSYFEREAIVRGRSIDENSIVASVASQGTLSSADLNKGVKSLWAEGVFDGIRTRYRKSGSVAWEAMDEERGIKQYNPKLYDELQKVPLYTTVFKSMKDGHSGVKAFSCDPTRGQIGFTRYSKEGEDSDELIRQILESN